MRVLLLILGFVAWGLGQTILVDGTVDGSFEGGTGCTGTTYTVNGWTIVNGTQTNRWAVDARSGGAQHGTRAIYITDNCGGSPPPHQYTITATSVVHFYRDITIPAGEPYLTISFWVIVQGEGTTTPYDYLDVFIAPTSVTPVAGTEVGASYRIARYNLLSNAWVSRTITDCAPRSGTVRLIFSWRNDGSVGTQPPAALDRIHVTSNSTAPSCNLGSGVVNVTSLPYNSGAGTTCGSGNDLTSSNTVTCGSTSYLGGEDQVFVFTPTSSGPIQINLTHSNASPPWFGLKLYQGCPTCGICIAYSQSSSGPYCLSANVTAGQTYYLVVDHYPAPSCASYDNIFISAPVGSSNACGVPTFTSFPVLTTGTTAGAPSLPVVPTCLTGSCLTGRMYQFVPTAANMSVHVAPGTLTDPAVAVYSASSCTGPFTEIACNDDGTGCESSPTFARVNLTGLTVGQTYYVAVFGGVGDYSLAIWETASQPPSQYGQDCDMVVGNPATGPIVPCGSSMTFGAPGFVGSGIVCDLPYPVSGCPNSCLVSGERNVVWFRLPISANGNLEFSIQPAMNVDYDWILYRIDGVSNPCQAVRSATLQPVRCSYDAPTSCDGTYNTGVACGSPVCASGTCEGASGQGWLSCVNVSAGQVYLLGISNFSTTTFTGFSVNFGTSPIAYQSNPSIWTGGAGNTNWNNATNWSGCGVPNSCTQDVFIYGGASNQPVIAAAETWTVRDITIPAGASLTVNGTLRVCGHLTVNGILNGTGWIEFIGDGTYPVQEIRGVLIGSSYIPNLRLRRQAVGTVRLMTDVQTGSVDITYSANHTLDLNGRRFFISGSFTNQAVTNIVSAVTPPSFVYFNGSGPQTYSDPASTTTNVLYNVTMTQSPASTLTLNNTLVVDGTLVLTNGVIVAPAATTREVRVRNTAPGAVTPGNNNSFVAGFLRRYLNLAGGSYDFPVGLSSPLRYSRINLNFSNNPGVHNLLATFTGWTPVTPSGSPIIECGADYSTCAMLNNGYWTVNAYAGDLTTQLTTSGTYTATLYNTGYTNVCAGGQQWGVLKNNGSAMNGAQWFIQAPGCAANTSPGAPAVVSRPGMSGFSHFGTGQSTQPLPVVLESFTGRVLSSGNHRLEWEVSLGEAGVSRFELWAGPSPAELQLLATLDGRARLYERVNAPMGRTYYQLHVYTTTGAHLTSSVVELYQTVEDANLLIVSVYPNPAKDGVVVNWVTTLSDALEVCLYNALGQRVLSRVVSQPAEQGEMSLSLEGLAGGLYHVEVRQGAEVRSVRLKVER